MKGAGGHGVKGVAKPRRVAKPKRGTRPLGTPLRRGVKFFRLTLSGLPSARTDRDWCVRQLRIRIEATQWKQARDNVRRFVKQHELPSLDLSCQEFFLAQCEKLV